MRNEYQIKLGGKFDPAQLIAMGAEPLGSVNQKDTYLSSDGSMLRIRDEGGQLIYTKKSFDKGINVCIRDVVDSMISSEEASSIERSNGVKSVICKTRDMYKIDDTLIAIDEVEQLGNFLEICSSSEKHIFKMLARLGFSEKNIIRKTYLDMMVEKSLPRYVQLIIRFHDKVGELAFGITSGILTTVGLLTGVNSATSSKLSVIASIAVIAVADSMSDAYGMYVSKISERGNSRKTAIRYALGTLAGKFFFPFTFILPILLLPLQAGVWVDLAWGAIALAVLSAENAIVSQKSVRNAVMANFGLAIFIVSCSGAVGFLIAKFVA